MINSLGRESPLPSLMERKARLGETQGRRLRGRRLKEAVEQPVACPPSWNKNRIGRPYGAGRSAAKLIPKPVTIKGTGGKSARLCEEVCG